MYLNINFIHKLLNVFIKYLNHIDKGDLLNFLNVLVIIIL